MLLDIRNVQKIYQGRFGDNRVEALRRVNFSVEEGEYIAIMGESGSGKTTLLNMLALLDKPTSGSIFLKGQDLAKIPDGDMARFRRENLGFVFQDFNLLDTFDLRDNILLPLVLAEEDPGKMEERLMPIARELRIEDLLNKYPYEVSGGQKQRAAIGRALISQPKILLADEPTGALDSNSSAELLQVFDQLNEAGQTILMVTHSMRAAAQAKRVLFIRDGAIYHQLYRAGLSSMEMQEEIAKTMQMLQRGEGNV